MSDTPLTGDDLDWLVKYAECVIYLCSKDTPNPYRPGRTFVTIIPDGGEWRYIRVYNADYYDAIASGLVPPALIRPTVHGYLIPHYAASWVEGEPGWHDKQGRGPCEKQGWTEENPQFIVKNVHRYWKLSGDISLFAENEETIRRYLLEHTAFYIPDPRTGALYLDREDVMDEQFEKRGYGFYDRAHLVGWNLFATLLLWEAYGHMAEMYAEVGDADASERFVQLARAIRANLLDLFWDQDTKLLLAATEVCRQADIWGSAYAVSVGILDQDTEETISKSLARYYDRIVWRGQVRHMLEPEGWESAQVPTNQYQNGGFWGTATGWIFRALLKTDRRLAEQTVADAIQDYRSRGAYEWVHPEEDRAECLHYVGNVGLLVGALVEEGYLQVGPSHCFASYLGEGT